MANGISSVATRPQSDHEVYSDCMQIAHNLAYTESIYTESVPRTKNYMPGNRFLPMVFGKRESDSLDERMEYIVIDLVSANFVYKISSMLRIAARRLDKHVVLVRGPCSQIAVLHLTVHQYMLHGPWVTAWP